MQNARSSANDTQELIGEPSHKEHRVHIEPFLHTQRICVIDINQINRDFTELQEKKYKQCNIDFVVLDTNVTHKEHPLSLQMIHGLTTTLTTTIAQIVFIDFMDLITS
uniref:Uncharacterized protein n=1 Tax=Glossina austeni TaxID=7395 RepID=A0A1A9VAW1_GLOAU